MPYRRGSQANSLCARTIAVASLACVLGACAAKPAPPSDAVGPGEEIDVGYSIVFEPRCPTDPRPCTAATSGIQDVIVGYEVLGSAGRAVEEISVIGAADGSYRSAFDLQEHGADDDVFGVTWGMDSNLRNHRWITLSSDLEGGRLKFRSPADGYPERLVEVKVADADGVATIHVDMTIAAS